MNILVVDDQQQILDFLREILSSEGFEVLTASNGVDALRLYQEHRPAFTLTDISMPQMNGIELLKQIKALNAEAVVMLMTGDGAEAWAIEALRGGAVNYFNKPVDIKELLNTIQRYASLAAGYDFELFATDFLREERLHMELKNDLVQINHAVQLIVNRCRSIFPLTDIFLLRFGIYEMLINAVEHGNLGINYEEKTRALEENRLNELIQERAEMPDLARRRVHVDCDITPAGLTCTIRDEGNGFDHSLYSSIQDPGQLFEELGTSLHGRGIMLTCLQFDKVEFNDIGNSVRIEKRAPATGGVPDSGASADPCAGVR
ncbi:response regulator [bacterium]|nr:response regulator [bacterium]